MKHLATTLMSALTLHAVSTAGFAATPADQVRSQVVRFADLDLTRPPGVQTLYRRIQSAARNVCETYDRLGRDRSCIDHAIARAVADVDAALLTTLHQAVAHRQALQPREERLNE